jgi:hypothetical protein
MTLDSIISLVSPEAFEMSLIRPRVNRERLENMLLDAVYVARGKFEANTSSAAACAEYKRSLTLFSQLVVEDKLPAGLELCHSAARKSE